MLRSRAAWSVAGMGALIALVVTGITVSACVPIVILRLGADQKAAGQPVPVPQVAPGGQISAYIHEISGSSSPPVTFHWDAVDGPVLATVQPTDDPGITANLTIPANASPGDHLIIATEPHVQATKGEYQTWGLPARAELFVTGAGASAKAASTAAPGPTGLSSDTGVSVGLLVLVAAAVAVAGVALVAGAGWALRRGATGSAATTR